LLIALLVVPIVRKKMSKPKKAPEVGISVQVGRARIGDMDSVVDVSGDIEALKSTVLSAKIAGRVVSVPYREGDSVSAGTVVVRQDTSDISAQVRQAEAGLQAAQAHLKLVKAGARSQELATAENAVASAKASYVNAKANYDRMNGLFADGAISKQQMDLAQMQYDVASSQYDTAKQQFSLVKAGARVEDVEAAQAGVAMAEATLAYARQQLANAYIRTPIPGTVSKRYTEPGEMASPGVPLIEIVALNTIYFEATVSEIDVAKIKVGQPVRITVDALPGRSFAGSVLKILPTADTKSRQFTIHIVIENRTGELKPGMFARGSIEIARHKNTVIIPKDALIASGEGQAVYAVVGSTAELRPVRIGFETWEEAEAFSGVQGGDMVVIVGQDKLSDGVKVNVAD
jgi:multidrug resistance efflux pump